VVWANDENESKTNKIMDRLMKRAIIYKDIQKQCKACFIAEQLRFILNLEEIDPRFLVLVQTHNILAVSDHQENCNCDRENS
jgi:hypothetical protein